MAKKRLVVSYENLPAGVIELVEKQYPEGWANHVMKVQTSKENFFFAILVDTEEISYLVKVKVKKDRKGIDADEDFLPEFDELSGPEPAPGPEQEPFAENHED